MISDCPFCHSVIVVKVIKMFAYVKCVLMQMKL